MATELTDECKAGYAGEANPHLHSSDAWLAHEAGKRLTGMSGVKDCFKSRGHSVRVHTTGGSTIRLTYRYGAEDFSIERT